MDRIKIIFFHYKNFENVSINYHKFQGRNNTQSLRRLIKWIQKAHMGKQKNMMFGWVLIIKHSCREYYIWKWRFCISSTLVFKADKRNNNSRFFVVEGNMFVAFYL